MCVCLSMTKARASSIISQMSQIDTENIGIEL